jgi:hypothetical protein
MSETAGRRRRLHRVQTDRVGERISLEAKRRVVERRAQSTVRPQDRANRIGAGTAIAYLM